MSSSNFEFICDIESSTYFHMYDSWNNNRNIIMASVTYGKCILIASVTYGKGSMASVVMAKVLWQMKLNRAMDLSKAFGLVSRNKLSPELID